MEREDRERAKREEIREERSGRNRWLLWGGIAALALVLLIGFWIPNDDYTTENRNNAQRARYGYNGYTESGDYGLRNNGYDDEDYRYRNNDLDTNLLNNYDDYNISEYMYTYPDDEHDFEIMFDDDVRSNDLVRYMQYLDDNDYNYTVSEYSPYVDDAMRNKYPDINYNYTFEDDDWENGITTYRDDYVGQLSRYNGTEDYITDINQNGMRAGRVVLKTSNRGMLNFLRQVPNARFAYYDNNADEQYYFRLR